MQQDFILGSEKDHFVLSQQGHCIIGLNKDLEKELYTKSYNGPLNICFPGCDKIEVIGSKAFRGLGCVSEINLSKLINLTSIQTEAFYNVGKDNKNFTNIDLRGCKCLRFIDKEAFSYVGCNSLLTVVLFDCPELIKIEEKAFYNTGHINNGQVVRDQIDPESDALKLDLTKCPNLQIIEREAFKSYKFHVNQKAIINLSGLKHLEVVKSRAFSGAFYHSPRTVYNFQNCENLKEIQYEAFDCIGKSICIDLRGCKNLEEIESKNFYIDDGLKGKSQIIVDKYHDFKNFLGLESCIPYFRALDEQDPYEMPDKPEQPWYNDSNEYSGGPFTDDLSYSEQVRTYERREGRYQNWLKEMDFYEKSKKDFDMNILECVKEYYQTQLQTYIQLYELQKKINATQQKMIQDQKQLIQRTLVPFGPKDQ